MCSSNYFCGKQVPRPISSWRCWKVVVEGQLCWDWNHLTECKQMSSNSFKNNVIYRLFVDKSHIYRYDLTSNNPWGLICHKKHQTRVLVPVRVPYIGQQSFLIIYKRLLLLVIWNHTAVCKLLILDRNTWLKGLLKLNNHYLKPSN